MNKKENCCIPKVYKKVRWEIILYKYSKVIILILLLIIILISSLETVFKKRLLTDFELSIVTYPEAIALIFAIHGYLSSKVIAQKMEINSRGIFVTNFLDEKILIEPKQIQYITRMETDDYYVVYSPFRKVVEKVLIMNERCGSVIQKEKEKEYKKGIKYVFDKTIISNYGKKELYIEPEDRWKMILKRRNQMKQNLILLFTLLILGICLLIKKGLFVYIVLWLGGFFWLILSYWLLIITTSFDYSSRRRRFKIDKDGIILPWIPPNSGTTGKLNKRRIKFEDIDYVYLDDRLVNKVHGSRYEVWVIKTKSGEEYILLPEFKSVMLNLLNTFGKIIEAPY